MVDESSRHQRKESQCDAFDHLHDTEGRACDFLLDNQRNAGDQTVPVQAVSHANKGQAKHRPILLRLSALRKEQDVGLTDQEDDEADAHK